MLVVEKVSLAKSWVVQRQNEIVAVILLEVIEVVAYHESVFFCVLRELLPNGSKIALIPFEIL